MGCFQSMHAAGNDTAVSDKTSKFTVIVSGLAALAASEVQFGIIIDL